MDEPASPDTKGRPSIGEAALIGLCPQCGSKTLFAGTARFAERCRACGLDFAKFNVGDGAAAFLILIIGAIVGGLAIWVQLVFEPAFWVHILLWIPLATALTLLGLRVSKAALLASEYRNKAGEGRQAK